MHKALPVLIFSLIYFYALSLLVDMFRADIYYQKSKNYFADKKLEAARDHINKAIELNPQEPRYFWGRARIYTLAVGEYELAKQPVEAAKLRANALEDLDTAYKLNRKNIVTIRNSIPLYYYLTVKNFATSAPNTDVDPNAQEITKNYYAMAAQKSATDVGLYALLAQHQKKLRLEPDATQSRNKVKALRPDLLEWYEPLQ